ncbi:MAG: hypothetical protein V4633_11990 [Pseudomonadota bacterium]
MSNFHRFGFLPLALCLFLGAVPQCPAKPLAQTLEKHLQSLSGKEGVALLKVVIPRTIVSPSNDAWRTLVIENTETKQSLGFVNVEDMHEAHALFVVRLPAGKYTLKFVDTGLVPVKGYGPNVQATRHGVLNLDGGGVFEVVAGHVSDLGTVLTIPIAYPVTVRGNQMGHYKTSQEERILHTRSPTESAQLNALIRQVAPTLALLAFERVWGFPEQPQANDIAGAVQATSAQFYSPLELASGEMYAGEEAGQIHYRARNGEWSWLNTGLTGAIRALDVMDDGTLLAGSSHGIVMEKRKDGDAWITHPLPVQDGVVIALGHNQHGVMASLLRDQQLVVLTKPALDGAAPWKELKRIELSKYFPTAIVARSTPDGFSLLEHSVGWSAKSAIHHFDAGSGVWRDVPLRSNWAGSTGATSLGADGTIFQIYGGTAFNQKMRISSDLGKTWAEFPTPGMIERLKMASKLVGYAQRIEAASIRDGKIWNTYSLWQTRDGARTWRKLGMAPAPLIDVVEMRPQELAATSDEGKLYRSKDDGKTWQEEIYLR